MHKQVSNPALHTQRLFLGGDREACTNVVRNTMIMRLVGTIVIARSNNPIPVFQRVFSLSYPYGTLQLYMHGTEPFFGGSKGLSSNDQTKKNVYIYIYLYTPGTHMTPMFEGQPP